MYVKAQLIPILFLTLEHKHLPKYDEEESAQRIFLVILKSQNIQFISILDTLTESLPSYLGRERLNPFTNKILRMKSLYSYIYIQKRKYMYTSHGHMVTP